MCNRCATTNSNYKLLLIHLKWDFINVSVYVSSLFFCCADTQWVCVCVRLFLNQIDGMFAWSFATCTLMDVLHLLYTAFKIFNLTTKKTRRNKYMAETSQNFTIKKWNNHTHTHTHTRIRTRHKQSIQQRHKMLLKQYEPVFEMCVCLCALSY